MKNKTPEERRKEKTAHIKTMPLGEMTLRDKLKTDGTLKQKPPVEAGQTIDVECFENAKAPGHGIAKVEGYIVFVKNAEKGFKGKATITRVFPKYAWAEAVER